MRRRCRSWCPSSIEHGSNPSYSVESALTRNATIYAENSRTTSRFVVVRTRFIIPRPWSRRPRRNGSYERRRFLVRARVTLSSGDGGWHTYGTPLGVLGVIVQSFRAFRRVGSRTENPDVQNNAQTMTRRFSSLSSTASANRPHGNLSPGSVLRSGSSRACDTTCRRFGYFAQQ